MLFKLDKHQLPQKKAKVEFHTCRGYRPKNGNYYRFSKENPSSLGSPAAKTECESRLLEFFVVFDDCPITELTPFDSFDSFS
jgi:hypothetical protein